MKKPDPAPEDAIPDMLKGMALESAVQYTAARNEKLSAALGWALANAHPMSTPEWRAEVMVRAGWIPAMKTPGQFNN